MASIEQRKYFMLAEFTGVDPDFDDEESDVALMLHEVATTGRIELHPDGNRMSSDFDPVPLHTRVYNDGSIAELKIREWAKHLEDLKRWRAERDEYEAKWAAQRAGVESIVTLDVAVPHQPPPQPGPLNAHRSPDPMENLLIQMRPHVPIAAGQGRVWENHVMVNETDLPKWNEDRMRRSLAEVWRGDGRVIFKLR